MRDKAIERERERERFQLILLKVYFRSNSSDKTVLD
jgi:hypothetical protein